MIYHYEVTGSTNADAKKLAEEGACHGTVVSADGQTAGRGRRGRQWYAPPGKNIYFSIVLRPKFSPERASMLTLVMALGVAKAMEKHGVLQPKIKWPNDIVLNKKKVCGILTEMAVESGAIKYVVVGVGINTNQTEFPEDIRETAGSLLTESGRCFDRQKLLQDVLECFEQEYARFLETQDMSPLLAAYNERLINRDAKVKVLDPKGEWNGVAKGINEKGELLVEKEDGSREAVYAGEVSVRGLYGYV